MNWSSLPKLPVLKRSKVFIQKQTPTPEPLLAKARWRNCPIHRIPSWNYPGCFDDDLSGKQINILEENLKVKNCRPAHLFSTFFCFQSTNSTNQDPGRMAVSNPIPPAPSERYVDPPGKTKGGIGMRPKGNIGNWNRQKDWGDKIALLKERLAKIDKQVRHREKPGRAHSCCFGWLHHSMGQIYPHELVEQIWGPSRNKLLPLWIQPWEKWFWAACLFYFPIPLVLFASCLTTLIESFKAPLMK